jgi:hypothetical protein
MRSFHFNMQGEVQKYLDDESSSNSRNLNYLVSEDFESLNKKFFSVKELENLLGSTDIYQRSYALKVLANLIHS